MNAISIPELQFALGRALIVRGADAGELDLAPQTSGLAAVSLTASQSGLRVDPIVRTSARSEEVTA